MILDGILVQPYGINCDAKILDTILRKQMIISAKKKKKQNKNKKSKNQILIIY